MKALKKITRVAKNIVAKWTCRFCGCSNTSGEYCSSCGKHRYADTD